MATETILYQNDIVANSNDFTATTKKSQESDCHRQKQKKKEKMVDDDKQQLVIEPTPEPVQPFNFTKPTK